MREFREKAWGSPNSYVFRDIGEKTNFESLWKQSLFGLSRISQYLIDFIYQLIRRRVRKESSL